ncbi:MULTISPECIES: hypothetical protein [Nocardia]|uniref:Uncharacterized protein n=1 Tax=Nocardia aurea TaxID=2144174 RepID=A0ABV3FUJ6_9NOCA|nr:MULTISPECIES: hypothetical protein [Nocardia]
MFHNNDDGVDWGGTTVVLVLVLVAAVLVLIVVSNADFGNRDRPTAPRTPGPCEPFCPAPRTP